MKVYDNDKKGFVYGLSDSSIEEKIRYIGITTTSLDRRLSSHLWDKDINHRTKWIKSVIANGNKVLITELDNGNINELIKREIGYILLFKSLGAKLVNGNIGGIGCVGYKWTKEQKEKQSILFNENNFWKGKTYEQIYGVERAAEIRRKVGEATKGRDFSNRKLVGKWNEEQKKNYSARKIGVYHKLGKVFQFKDGILINTFDSIIHAERCTGISESAIRYNCVGYAYMTKKDGSKVKYQVNSVKGYIFKREKLGE